jgi:hypothetical protein
VSSVHPIVLSPASARFPTTLLPPAGPAPATLWLAPLLPAVTLLPALESIVLLAPLLPAVALLPALESIVLLAPLLPAVALLPALESIVLLAPLLLFAGLALGPTTACAPLKRGATLVTGIFPLPHRRPTVRTLVHVYNIR